MELLYMKLYQPKSDLDAVQFYQSWGCSVLGEVDGYCVLRTEID